MMQGELPAMEAAFQALAKTTHGCDVQKLLPLVPLRVKAQSWWPLGADPHAR